MKTKILCTFFAAIAGLLFTEVVFAAVQSKDEVEQRAKETKIRNNCLPSFVTAHYYFKKSKRPQPPADDDDYNLDEYEEQETLKKILDKQTTDAVGVIISKDGHIFIADNYFKPEMIEKMTVTGPDGQTLDAEQDRILTCTPGQIIRLKSAMPEKWKSLDFVASPATPGNNSKLYYIFLSPGIEHEGCSCTGCELTNYLDEKKDYSHVAIAQPVRSSDNLSAIPDYFLMSHYRQPKIICDANGLVLGISAYNMIETGKDAPAWKGSDILADPGIKRQTAETEIKENFSKYLYQVKFTFRLPPKEDDEYDMGMYASFWRGCAEVVTEKKKFWLMVLPSHRTSCCSHLRWNRQWLPE